MTTDTTERGIERLICTALTGSPCDPLQFGAVAEGPIAYNAGWACGAPHDYDREYCVDIAQLSSFLKATQPDAASRFDIDGDTPVRRKFLARLSNQVSSRGTVDVLRNGLKHGPDSVDLFYGAPSRVNIEAVGRWEANRFSVTRQLRYSLTDTRRALDLCLFVNGLPIATFEIKNSLTAQTVQDAIEQYRCDRAPRETLFELGRCMAHFAVDDNEVYFCTRLDGKRSVFMPFNRGWNDGTGNPPNPDGLKTAYLWEETLTRESLTNIIENYAQIVQAGNGRNSRKQIWPRFHQLEVTRKLLEDASQRGAGRRYLIQHSAGSGKSNSIAWLAHQLVEAEKDGKPVFDSIIVVTDRKILDRQIQDTVKQFAQIGSIVHHAEKSVDLRRDIESGKKIIISTLQKFPFILDGIGAAPRGRTFAIIIDEAHSSQGGSASAAVSDALGYHTTEDKINQIIESKKLLPNASYFAFTATPKNKTLEMFGEPIPRPDGATGRRPFHSYTMKQAIQEGFIVDVLQHYTPVSSYYKLVKAVEDDPKFDTKRSQSKLRRYVEAHEYVISLKTEIMVDHFYENVLGQGKIGGKARAMIVTDGIQKAIDYYHALTRHLKERKSCYEAIVAFSGEHDYGGSPVTEASLNGFPSSQIAAKFKDEPYRFLVCADKFQTGYDEPLLHTMYVDKVLSGVKAVQTLSRLNRSHSDKYDAFVLDFTNDADTIQNAFSDYYRTTLLSDETDPNRLHDLKASLDDCYIYSSYQIERLVERYLGGADRGELDPILNSCVTAYLEQLDEAGQIDFKGKAKAFLRAYGFLASILPYNIPDWEKFSIFLTFLVPKLPAPAEEDMSQGILAAIDMDSYRAEKQAARDISLPDENSEIGPVPELGGRHKPDPENERLSSILREFNDKFGNIDWKDHDRIRRVMTKELPAKVTADKAYQNAIISNSDPQNARIEHDKALERAITNLLSDDVDLFQQFSDNQSFRHWLSEMIFSLTYGKPSKRQDDTTAPPT